MSRRGKTVTIGLLVVIVFGVIAGIARVPLVALGPGPTFDTLGEVGGKTVVSIVGRPTYPTSGQLNMTTVAVTDGLTAVTALRFWADPRRRVVPRAAIYPPDKTDEQVEQENARQFTDSETKAEAAALSYLGVPVRVLVDGTVDGGSATGVLQPGDQLLTVNGTVLDSAAQVSQLLMATKPGDQIEVGFQRGDGPPQTGSITLGARPGFPQGFLGILPGGLPVNPDEITISLGDIGGPSAGLPFALAVVDKLTPGELTGGRFVAGTGEILATGQVGKIGGITLKMIAAKEAGATVFLVPDGNCDEARAATPEGLQLIRVAALADAVDGLTALEQGRTPPAC